MVNVNFKNMRKFLILISLFISSLSIAETVLECIGTYRVDITNGTDVNAGESYKKTLLYVLHENKIRFENFEVELEQSPTHYTWFWNPKIKSPSLNMTIDIVSGELNRINGKTYFRKTFIDDKNVPKYREEVFKGECNETEARF